MFIQRGKTNWIIVIILALLATIAVAFFGLRAYMNSPISGTYTVMHFTEEQLQENDFDRFTLQTTTESSEEWINRIKPYLEAGWWPENNATGDYLESMGYKKPVADWFTDATIKNRLYQMYFGSKKN